MGLGKLFGGAKKIPVLAYDIGAVSDSGTAGDWQKQLKIQLEHHVGKRHHFLSLDAFLDIAKAGKAAQDKALLLTFDGATALGELRDLLISLNLQATAFISAKAINATSIPDLKADTNPVLQLAMNGFDGEDYSALPLLQAKENLEAMMSAFESSGLQYYKVMAFPKGKTPKSRNDMILLKALMTDAGIEAAFKLGGKAGRVPSMDFFEISRIPLMPADAVNTVSLNA